MSTLPITPQRLAANRANAARSTGPKSPAGKSHSAQNSRKHGFTAENFAVIRLEELDAVAKLRDDLITDLQPVNSQELFAIERIALAQQALLRAETLETGFFTSCLNHILGRGDALPFTLADDLTRDIEVTRAQNRGYALAEGLQQLTRQSAAFSLILRYKVQTERLYRRSVEDFTRLRKLNLPASPAADAAAEAPEAEIAPNEPTSAPQPQQPPSLTPSETNPPVPPPDPPQPAPRPIARAVSRKPALRDSPADPSRPTRPGELG
jgi:hypothetical protein